MQKIICILSICCFSICWSNRPALAYDSNKKIGIGIGYPYISIKYGHNTKYSAEARGAFGEGISILGARLYYNFKPVSSIIPFLGIEGDYTMFESDDLSGKGFITYVFAGGEYSISKRISLTMDIGTAYIGIWENDYDLNVRGFEFVFNVGVNFYFLNLKK